MLFWVWLASGPIKMRKNSAGGRAKTGNRAKSRNAAKQTPSTLHKIARAPCGPEEKPRAPASKQGKQKCPVR
jgi:hypothetical protein